MLEKYKTIADKIERKVKTMKKFEKFLEKVKEANPDEFSELQDILSRHKQLISKNEELHGTQERYTNEIDQKTKELTEYIKEMEVKILTINNQNTNMKTEYEQIENERAQLLAQKDENAKLKSEKTTETGRILMTIDNLFFKCQEKKIDQFFAVKDFKDHESLKNYDDTTKSGRKAIEQVKIIIQVIQNFKELS